MSNIDENYFIKSKNPNRKDSVESVLSEDEEILLRLKPNKKAYVLESLFKGLPFALIWLAFDVFFIFMIITSWSKDAGMGVVFIPFLVIFFLLHLTPVWIFIANLVKRVAGLKNVEYVLTDKRVIVRSGVIAIDFKSLYYSEISGINVKASWTDKIFKVGDIYITAATQSAVLDDISDPYFLMGRIHQITMDIKADIEFPNDLRPSENHGYKTTYKNGDEK